MMRANLWVFGLTLACATAGDPAECFEPTVPAYNRDEWGRWQDVDRDCQDTRAEVLILASQAPVSFAEGGQCRVVTGDWVDPYTGSRVTDAALLDVDHVVPLAEAHATGGWAWDAARKRSFANDVSNLRAAGRSANRSKGAQGPGAWLPAFEGTRCGYLQQWLEVKGKWGLSTSTEGLLVRYMLGLCGRGLVPATP